MGRILRTAPNTVQRHLETLQEASTRATRISDANGVLVSGSMRNVRIGTRNFLDPLFYIVGRLLRLTSVSRRNVNFCRCRDRLAAKPKRYGNMPVFLEVTLQSRASALMVYEIDTRQNCNN